MSPADPRQRGFTLLELTIAIVFFGVLATVLLNRLAYYQEMAEKAAMESTLRSIKTGLQVRLAEMIIANREGQAKVLEAQNPVLWLDDAKPSNYGGDCGERRVSGAWCFDPGEHQLVYVANTGGRLKIDGPEGVKELRFRVQLVRGPVYLPGGAVERTSGIVLAPVHPYRWL